VRVNCIQPGLVAGDRINRVIEARAKSKGISFEQEREESLAAVSLRTFVTAQDIANMALFVSTEAGKNITGQALSVCGDHQHLS